MSAVQTAITLTKQYGGYPVSHTFENNDAVPDLPENMKPAYDAAFDADDSVKRHSACDECRKRKLKCSGEPTGCTRCIKQKLTCHYSEQKQMGRPRKRLRTDSDDPMSNARSAASPPKPIQPAPGPNVPDLELVPELSIDPNLAAIDAERSQFENVCPGTLAQAIRIRRNASLQDSNGSESSPNTYNNGPRTPDPTSANFDFTSTSYPTDVANWPDFSDLSILPVPVEDKFGAEPYVGGLPHTATTSFDSNTQFDPDANPEALTNLPAVPACPCLPNLYLTLSTLSTLSSFPFTAQTITTLETAHRTARAVIYCAVCPQKFNTGSSNLMLGCTLLTVLADQWGRLRKISSDQLRSAFGTKEQANSGFVTIKEGRDWRSYAHQLLRAYVFDDEPIPTVPRSPNSPSNSPDTPPRFAECTLISLVHALQRRQRQWHGLEPATDEFVDKVNVDDNLTEGHFVGAGNGNPGKHLCLEIIGHAECIVKGLDRPVRCDGAGAHMAS